MYAVLTLLILIPLVTSTIIFDIREITCKTKEHNKHYLCTQFISHLHNMHKGKVTCNLVENSKNEIMSECSPAFGDDYDLFEADYFVTKTDDQYHLTAEISDKYNIITLLYAVFTVIILVCILRGKICWGHPLFLTSSYRKPCIRRSINKVR